MIVSHQHKFIFIKTEKTAGTSIEVFLSQHCGPRDILTPIIPAVDGHQPRNYNRPVNSVAEFLSRPWGLLPHFRSTFFNHSPAWMVQKRVSPRVWKTYFKFCVERNPWDKVLSHYYMWAAGSLSLNQYFKKFLAEDRLPINYPRYTDTSGKKIIVDRVLRYEKLDEELTSVFTKLGIPFDGSLRIRAKAGYRTDRAPYQSVFNDEQRRIVERVFAPEIELHGYRF